MSFTVPSSAYRRRPRSTATTAVLMYVAAGLLLGTGFLVLLELVGGRGGANGAALLLVLSVSAAVGELILAGRVWQGASGAHRWSLALNGSVWILFAVVSCANTIDASSFVEGALAPPSWAQDALVGLTLATDVLLLVVIGLLVFFPPYQADQRPG